MSFEARCPQCLFLTRQLGQPTPCLLHVSLAPERDPEPREERTPTAAQVADYDEPYVFGRSRPTVDRPGPFSVREYVRLQLLRSRIHGNPSPLDRPARRVQARSLSRR
ncbi:MAG TPA: hypothetical protein VK898_12975 [Chloroflexota bacterium]|nr:hypothetical protein [Chloroflexota bacterium]